MNFLGSVLATIAFGAAAPAVPELPAGCRLEGATGFESVVLLSACETARQRFAELFGAPVPPVTVVLWSRPGYRIGTRGERAVLFWPEAAALGDGWRSHDGPKVLPHEIAHALLAARFFSDGDASWPPGYGTPLPDWLDEGVAIWAEPASSRRTRLAQAKLLPSGQRDLNAILAARHPAGGSAAALAMRDGASPPDDPALWAFYPQSAAVLGFVYRAGGRAALIELTRRLLEPDRRAHALAGLPGLPEDSAALVAEWERWLGDL